MCTLVLFDIDGTLTKSRQIIKPEMKKLLQQLKTKVKVGLVGGSDFCKAQEQMDTDCLEKEFDYIFSENGLVAYKNGKLLQKTSLKEYLGEDKIKGFINFTLKTLSDIDVPVKRGNFIEFRTGMINVSPCGRQVTQEEREEFNEYDSKHKIRKNLINQLTERFPNSPLTYSIGGQISIDIFPKGWDKTYCLQFVEKDFKVIHFFGDNTISGKNDYEIYMDPRTVGHTVKSPEDTAEQIKSIFNL